MKHFVGMGRWAAHPETRRTARARRAHRWVCYIGSAVILRGFRKR
jgi:hypothetical protein